MKTRLFIVLFAISIFTGCNNSEKKKDKPAPKKAIPEAKYETLSSRIVIGDFNGDKIADTLIEMHNSGKADITRIPLFDEYDDTVDYFYKNDIQTSLQANYDSKIKPLELGISFGTECAINIGDNNKDGKDELAVVIAYCDFSMLNSCKVYSLCGSEWKILNKFSVHEDAFMHEDNEKLDPNKIKDYLEKKNEKWFYADYLEVLNAEDTLSKMKPLILKKCN